MNFFLCLEVALREIWAHRFRSFLSMLGIILGVSSLLATLALTSGIEAGIRKMISELGGLEQVDIIPKEISSMMTQDLWSLSPGRTLVDAQVIKNSASLVSHVTPEMNFGAQVHTFDVEYTRYQITGVWPDYLQIRSHEMAAGRFICDLDLENANHVAVIGNTVSEKLWPQHSPEQVLGKTLFINGTAYTVIGVFPLYERDWEKKQKQTGQERSENLRRLRRGQGARFRDPYSQKNQAVVIPFTTMFYDFLSGTPNAIDSYPINSLSVKVGSLEFFDQALEQVRTLLEITHRGVDDYGFNTKEEWIDRMNANVAATRLSGGIIAGISLLVGGIGIANIMLASISERVREIGIRRAVGARGRDIFMQILVESVSIATIGAVLGIFAGFGLMEILVMISPSQNTPVLEIKGVIISVSFAVLAGIVSGIYPALRASRLDPITALRYE